MMQFDGKGIVMIPAGLRAETAKAARITAARAGRRATSRLAPGEKHGRKRMAEVAAVYDAIPVPRTPADVINLDRPGPGPGPGPGAGAGVGVGVGVGAESPSRPLRPVTTGLSREACKSGVCQDRPA